MVTDMPSSLIVYSRGLRFWSGHGHCSSDDGRYPGSCGGVVWPHHGVEASGRTTSVIELPHLFAVWRYMALIQPSSVTVERVFFCACALYYQ